MIMCTAKVTRAVPARKQAPPAIIVALRPHLHISPTPAALSLTSGLTWMQRQYDHTIVRGIDGCCFPACLCNTPADVGAGRVCWLTGVNRIAADCSIQPFPLLLAQ
jgi:hypothetical protein